MNYLCQLLRCYDARISSVSNKWFETIDERGGEEFDFAVEEIIEVFSLVRDVVVKSLESYSQVLKILGYHNRVTDRDYSIDDGFTWWNGIIDGFSFLPKS